MISASNTFSRIWTIFKNTSFHLVFHDLHEKMLEGKMGMFGILLSPVSLVVSEVFKDFSKDEAIRISDDVMERLGKNPKELNHHLQGLFLEAIQQSIEIGIPACYESQINEGKKTNHFKFSKANTEKFLELSQQFKYAFQIKSNKTLSSGELIKYIDEKNPANWSLVYKNQNRVGPEYYPDAFFDSVEFPSDYAAFYKQNFFPVIRILFIEGLKSKEHSKALVAYEQMMSEETYRSLLELKMEISELKKTNALSTSKFSEFPISKLSNSVEQINSKSEIESKFEKHLEYNFQIFDNQISNLLTIAEDTNRKTTKIGVVTEKNLNLTSKNLFVSYLTIAIIIATVIWGYLILFNKDETNLKFRVIDENNKSVKIGFMYLDIKSQEESEEKHILGKLNNDGIITFEKVKKIFIENDSAEITLFGELEEHYKIGDASKYIKLKGSNMTTILLINEISKPKANILEANISKADQSKRTEILSLNCDISGVMFKDEYSEDNHIQFHDIKNGVIGFTGKIEIINIEGEAKIMSESSMLITSGDVKGRLTINKNCDAIYGSITILSNGATKSIDYKK